jgi:cell division septum initiation protein DivIVA
MTRPSLDEIAAAAEDAKRRQQQERIRQMTADMVDELDRIKAEDWQPPFDVDAVYVPEQIVPLDWKLQEEIAKEAAKRRLSDEPREPDSAGYTIYVEDSD